MTTVEVFDPPMCCSTGVCGPSVDPALAAFAADLGRLSEQGVVIERHNLSQEPKVFAESDLVRELLAQRGDEALPVVVVDGALRSSGRYPLWGELEAWTREAAGTGGGLDARTAEHVAMGGAVGSGTDSADDVPTVACCGEAAADAEGPSAQTSGGCCVGGLEVTEVPLVGTRTSGGCCG